MTRPRLFVELCAGTAATSLRLQGGAYARPPVSRMGAKTGYSRAILSVLGLRAGQGADHYLWCEPDPGCRLLLEAYRDRELALDAAEVIRGWADEDPRELWDRLRAEGPAQHEVDPREVARWVLSEAWTNSGRYMGPDRPSSCHPDGWVASITRDGLCRRLTTTPTLPATILPDARAIEPEPPLDGMVVYLDPPYQGTTGYAHDLPRDQVVELARRWADAGALVAVSEAEPIPELVALGWYQVEITDERRGQRRTFSRQQVECLTLNRPPAWRPAVQGSLFG